MKVTIPLYVEEHRPKGGAAVTHVVRPLFFAAPVERGEQLNRVVAKLAGEIRKVLDALGEQARHDELARWTYCPELDDRRFSFNLPLRRQTAEVRATVVSFAALGRRLAFFPAMPVLWFEVLRGQELRDRAAEVLSDYLKKQEKDVGDDYEPPTGLARRNRGWVTTIDLDVAPRPKLEASRLEPFIFLGGPGKMSGRAELNRVGRCLDWLYPDDLDRAVLREAEVSELTRLLDEHDRRPVLLLGRRRVGKTAVVHETVYRRVAKRKSPHVLKNNIWLLAPQRLISGMMYVGQWENRLLAILDEAKEQGHVLYFDDVLGLYQAGLSRDSDLNVATVMRPFVERRDFRMLAEMTPEAFRVLQERDRGFADLFHVLPVNEPTEPQTRRILVSMLRDLEGKHGCRFGLDVMPTVLDLTGRYARDAAHPGKSAGFLRDLAYRHRGASISRQSVLNDFHARSGLSVTFLDTAAKLERQHVVEELSKHVVGQAAAVGAMADTVCVAKARLNDPGRPLASMLFLGPTGVGKTQSAKALAAYLFGSAERLVRFDMNEFVDPSSASRLVGTFLEPEGLLTSAVRRQPFSVVLLDEIEKAHPAVFDLLLQVLGEGRLTDALGRTADFANAIVVMTSNLGAREAGRSFGLRPDDGRRERAVYVEAAERFFRPEFFNRIDRVVPFEPLSREQIGRIARRLIADVFARDGLVQRRCVLRVEPEAMERIIDEGYHPQLGARALKRAVERQLTQPVASRLAAMASGQPTVIHVYPSGETIAVDAQALVNAAPLPYPPVDLSGPEELLNRVDDFLARVEQESAGLEQVGGALAQGRLSDSHFRYLTIRGLVERVRGMVQRADRALERRHRPSNWVRATARAPRKTRAVKRLGGDVPRDLFAAHDLHAQLADLVAGPDAAEDPLETQLTELVRTASFLQAVVGTDAAGSPPAGRCLMLLRSLSDATGFAEQTRLVDAYVKLFDPRDGFTAARLPPVPAATDVQCLLIEMPGAAAVLAPEQGTHLFFPRHGQIVPVQVKVIAPGPDEPTGGIPSFLAVRGGDAFRLDPVIRVYDEHAVTLDLRSGATVDGIPGHEELRQFVLVQLPPPEELTTGPAI